MRMPSTALGIGLILAISSTALASPTHDVSVVGTGLVSLTPSADSLTLDSATDLGVSGTFALQTGTYAVGDSGDLSGHFGYTITENITIDGQTLPITFTIDNFVQNPSQANVDVLTINPGPATFFSLADVILTPLGYISPSFGVGGSTSFILDATLTAVPEPTSLVLFGTALAGLGAIRRRAQKGIA